MGGFCLLVELHREGCAPATFAAGLLVYNLNLNCITYYEKFCERMTSLTKNIFRFKTKMTESMYNLSNADIEVSSKIKPSLKFNK